MSTAAGPKGVRLGVIGGSGVYEMEGVEPAVAREAMRLAAHKLPVPCRFVIREET